MEKPPPYSSAPPPGMAPPPPGMIPSYGDPPLQPISPPYPSQQGYVYVTSGPTIVTTFGPNPQYITCPSCHAQITTSIKTEPNSRTHLFALLLCIFGCYLCCCIPYCVDSCQNQNHYCPHCDAYLGSYANA